MKLPGVANLLMQKMFNVFSDKPALKLGQQFTGTAAETTPPHFFRFFPLLFFRLNAVNAFIPIKNAAIFPVKRR